MTDYNQNNSDEISLKFLIQKIQEYWKELWRNWLLIGLFCIPFLLYFAYKHFTTVPQYRAKLTYMLNSNDDNSMAGFASLLGSFGISKGGGKGLSLEKLVELSRSRAIIQKTIFNKVKIGDKEDYLANFIIDLYDFRDLWEDKKPELVDFRFTNSDVESFSYNENYVLKSVCSRIVGNAEAGVRGLMSSSFNEESGILNLTTLSISEEFSTHYSILHFEELKEFFIDKTIEKQKLNYEIMKQKTDSLYGELRSAEFALANFKDSNLGIYTKKDNLTELRLEGQIRMLYAGLAKALENLEIADFTLKYQTPFIQTVDTPVIPLSVVRSSLIMKILTSLILGCLLGIGFVLIRKMYRDTMS